MSPIKSSPATGVALPLVERALYRDWQTGRANYQQSPKAALELAQRANSAGEHLLALEIVESVLANSVEPVERVPLILQKALALARSAATHQALQTVEQISGINVETAEVFALFGRIYESLAEASSNPQERQGFLARALTYYQDGFHRTRSTTCGVSAAALAVLNGDPGAAQNLAAQIRLNPQQDDPFLDLVTRAEAALILRLMDEADDFYRQASAAAQERWKDLATARKQCRELSAMLFGRRELFDQCFPAAAIAIFVGHIPDAPERKEPRFPETARESVGERIAAWLKLENIRVSYCSAAAGSDLIFLSTAQAMGVATHIVLPFAINEFLQMSVSPRGAHWTGLFHEALAGASSVTIVNDDVADDATSAFDYSNQLVAAKAALRASALELPLAGLCVWNGHHHGDGRGGTADTVAVWSRAKIRSHVINPLAPECDGPLQVEHSRMAAPFPRTQTGLGENSYTCVCTMMHLYFDNYFSLREKQFKVFQKFILGRLAEILAATPHRPVSRHGLGPDYVFVFETPQKAGLFAIAVLEGLAERLQDPAAQSMTLPRLCLHAGPVQLMVNPVLNQYSHEGTSLTRAGRIVRNVEPGVAYCTEPFAALSALEDIEDFRCEYNGLIRYDNGAQDRIFSVRYRQKTSFK